MGRRLWGQKPFWQCRWPSIGTGRYVKRLLSKARRRQAKEELRSQKVKNISGIESDCNNKTW